MISEEGGLIWKALSLTISISCVRDAFQTLQVLALNFITTPTPEVAASGNWRINFSLHIATTDQPLPEHPPKYSQRPPIYSVVNVNHKYST